jgi:predicted MFS family arabinose efflux permease
VSRSRARAGAAFRGGPLASRSFRLLAIGQLTSTIGDYCYDVALPWLVLTARGGPVLLGTVLACYGIPRAALIPVGGILADRAGPRVVMLGADAARCLLVAVMVLLALRHLTTLALLGPVAAGLGAGAGLFIPASFTIMPSLLDPARLQAGNALNEAAVQIGSLTGPALGGILVASAGSAPAFAVDAATFAVSAFTLALVRTAPRPAAQPGDPASGLAAAAKDGEEPAGARGRAAQATVWQLLRRERLLRLILAISVAANFTFGGTFEVALPALAHARFGAAGYGALIACFGAGAVAGTLAAARNTALLRPAVVAFAAFLIESAAAGLIPFLGGLPGGCAACLALGACNGFGNVITLTLVQRWAPPRLLGRVMSLIMLASFGTFPISVAISGILVRSIGPVPFFPLSGAVLAVTILVALGQRELRSLGAPAREAPAGPAGPADQAEAKLT